MSESDIAVSLWKRQDSSSLRNSSTTIFSDDIIEVNFENDFQFPSSYKPSTKSNIKQQNPLAEDRNVLSLEKHCKARQQSTLLWRYDGSDGVKVEVNASHNTTTTTTTTTTTSTTTSIKNKTKNTRNNTGEHSRKDSNNETGLSHVTTTPTTTSSSSPFSSNNTTLSNDIHTIQKSLSKLNYTHNQNKNIANELKKSAKPRRISEPVMSASPSYQMRQNQQILQYQYRQDRQEQQVSQKPNRRFRHNRRNSGASAPRGTTFGCLKHTSISPSSSSSSISGKLKQEDKKEQVKVIPSTSSDTPWGLRDCEEVMNKNDNENNLYNELDYSNNLNINIIQQTKKISETILFRGDRRSTSTGTSINSKVMTKFTSFIRRVFRRSSGSKHRHEDEKISEISHDEQEHDEKSYDKGLDGYGYYNGHYNRYGNGKEYIYGAEHVRNEPTFHSRGYYHEMYNNRDNLRPFMSYLPQGNLVRP